MVLDTNIVLDLLLFADPATQSLGTALQNKTVQWLTTQSMRDELERVLAYAHILPRMDYHRRSAAQILGRFDEQAQRVAAAPRAMYVCKDADDQKFIDLAVAHRALLLSKDSAVLCMKKRLSGLGVQTATVWPG